MKEPTRAEVLAWCARTKKGAAEAVAHFWPGCGDQQRTAKGSTIRSWLRRAQLAAQEAPPAAREPPRLVPLPPPPRVAREEDAEEPEDQRPDPEAFKATVALDRIRFLEWQLGELLADLAWSRARGAIAVARQVDARVAEVRLQLDQARGEAGRVVAIDRSPAEVAAAVLARRTRLEQLAAARAARARDL